MRLLRHRRGNPETEYVEAYPTAPPLDSTARPKRRDAASTVADPRTVTRASAPTIDMRLLTGIGRAFFSYTDQIWERKGDKSNY